MQYNMPVEMISRKLAFLSILMTLIQIITVVLQGMDKEQSWCSDGHQGGFNSCQAVRNVLFDRCDLRGMMGHWSRKH